MIDGFAETFPGARLSTAWSSRIEAQTGAKQKRSPKHEQADDDYNFNELAAALVPPDCRCPYRLHKRSRMTRSRWRSRPRTSPRFTPSR